MKDPFFFGYGSLVNRATHDYPEIRRARVTGYRRAWVKTRLRRLAFLSVVEAPGTEIEGLIAAVPGGDWRALDLRERAYRRHRVVEIDHDHGAARDIQIYRTDPTHEVPRPDPAIADHPIPLSYLDTVIQGYLREFGQEGAARFFDTTDGWEAGVLDDRARPLYARVQEVTRVERGLVDAGLDALHVPIRVLGPDDPAP